MVLSSGMVKYIVLLFVLVSVTCSAQIYMPRFEVQGHRGARGLKPENTIPAFITALDSGVMTLEMDVVITKDKQVILSHEPFMSASICLDTAGRPISEKDEKKYNIYSATGKESIEQTVTARCYCGRRRSYQELNTI